MRYLLAVLCALSLVAAQSLYGGAMRPVFALPAFVLVGLAGVGAVFCFAKKTIFSPDLVCLFLVAAFAGWLIWREMTSPDYWLATNYFRLTLACLVIYLLFACVLANPYHRLAFLGGVLLLALLQSALAFWQATHRHEGFLLPWLSEQLRIWYSPRFNGQAHGFFLNKNQLAWFLNVGGFFSLAIACWGRWKITVKILCLYVALASFAAVVLTASRGGILGTAGGLLVFSGLSVVALAVGGRQQRIVPFVVLAAGIVMLVGMMVFVLRSGYVAQERFGQLLSDSYRAVTFSSALRQAQLDPLVGTGPGSFVYYGRQYRGSLSPADDIYAHNDWIQVTGDFGFPAVALLILVVLVHAANGWRGLLGILLEKRRSYERPLSHVLAITIGSLSCLAVFATHSFFDFNMQIPANALLAAAVLGMLGSVEHPGASAQRKARHTRLGWLSGYILVVACSCWLLLAVYQAARPEYYSLRAENALLRGEWRKTADFAAAGLSGGVSPALWAIKGEALLQIGRTAEQPAERQENYGAAVDALAKAVESAPKDWSYHVKFARALWRLGKLRQAEKEAFEAMRLNPFQAQAYDLYASILESRNDLSAAADASLLLRNLPGDYSWHNRYEDLRKRLELQRKNAQPSDSIQP